MLTVYKLVEHNMYLSEQTYARYTRLSPARLMQDQLLQKAMLTSTYAADSSQSNMRMPRRHSESGSQAFTALLVKERTHAAGNDRETNLQAGHHVA